MPRLATAPAEETVSPRALPSVIRVKCALQVHAPTIQVRPTIDTIWTWSDTSGHVDIPTVNTALMTFLNGTVAGQTHTMSYYMGDSLLFGANTWTFTSYDITSHLSGTPAGAPVNVTNHTPTDDRPSGTLGYSLPEQIALVCSYRADYGTDVEYGPPNLAGHPTRPRASDRGRFWLGPLNVQAITTDSTTGQCVTATAFHTDAMAALGQLLMPHTGGGSTAQMMQWSRKKASIQAPTHFDVNTRLDVRRRRAAKSGVHAW